VESEKDSATAPVVFWFNGVSLRVSFFSLYSLYLSFTVLTLFIGPGLFFDGRLPVRARTAARHRASAIRRTRRQHS
jgi:hypothetical protein